MRCVLLIIAFLIITPPLSAQTNRALIVGVGEYDELSDLKKTVGDAHGYAKALSENLNFEVQTLIDPDRVDFLFEFDQFVEAVEPGDRITFIFSGHGWSDGALNYLAFRDAPKAVTGGRLKYETVALNDYILEKLKSRKPAVVLAVIDACRNNPFELTDQVASSGLSLPPEFGAEPLNSTETNSLEGAGLATRSMTRGLERVGREVSDTGTLIIYSAGAGETALDRLSDEDPSPYSVFTRAFIPRLIVAEKSLMRAASDARAETARLAAQVSHSQRPAIYSDVSIDFCFAETCPQLEIELDNERSKSNALVASVWENAARERFKAERYSDHTRSLLLALYSASIDGESSMTLKDSILQSLTRNKLEHQFSPVVKWDWDNPDFSAPTTTIALSRDGSRIAIEFENGGVELWDMFGRQLLHRIEPSTPGIQFLGFSDDNTFLGVGLGGRKFEIWDVATGTLLHAKEHGSISTDGIAAMAFSPDNSTIAVATYPTPSLWDVNSGNLVYELEELPLGSNALAFSPDGSSLAAINNILALRVWDIANQKIVINTPLRYPGLAQANVKNWTFGYSPDASTIHFGSWSWEAHTGIKKYDNDARSYRSATSPNGQVIANIEKHHFQVGPTGKRSFEAPYLRLERGKSGSDYIAFSSDGTRLIAGNLFEGDKIWRVQHSLIASAHDIAPDFLTKTRFRDDAIIARSSKRDSDVITLRNLTQNLDEHSFDRAIAGAGRYRTSGNLEKLVVTPDDNRGAINIWDEATNKKLGGVELPEVRHDSAIQAVSLDGGMVALHLKDDSVFIWNTDTGEFALTDLTQTISGYRDLTFSPDNSLLYGTLLLEKTAILWDAKTGAQLASFEDGAIPWANNIYSSDGAHIFGVSSAVDGKKDIVRLNTNSFETEQLIQGLDQAGSLSVSSDQRVLAILEGNQTVSLWDTLTGARLLSLSDSEISFSSAEFSEDGKKLLTGKYSDFDYEDDNYVMTWDISLIYEPISDLIDRGCRLLSDTGVQTAFTEDEIFSVPYLAEYYDNNPTAEIPQSPCTK